MVDYFSELLNFIKKDEFILNIIISLIWLVVIFLIKWSIYGRITQSHSLSKIEKVNIKKNINSYLLVALFFILIFIWFTQLQSLLVSFVAVAAALVLATKEIIMCVTGGILISISDHFKRGDRIEVDGLRGFVIQKNLTTTKLLEIGPEINSQQTTGKIITIPNSLMLNKAVKNESFFSGYSINLFSFPVNDFSQIAKIEEDLIKWAEEICQSYLEVAKTALHKFSLKEGVNIPSLAPRTKLILVEHEKIDVLLKMVVKNSEIADVEQTLLRKYLEKYKV
ncbi:MAG: mechanosensitive ion channel [Bdellovibrionales bacterium]|nr:mechanosensitive ion channel [Bdellovibrionales bacterium]